MHHHPDTVAVFLTDANGTFSYPDGKKKDFMVKAGDAQYSVAETTCGEHQRQRDGCDCNRTKRQSRPCSKIGNEVISTTAQVSRFFETWSSSRAFR